MFQGLNAFLMHHGCDVFSSLAELHAAASPIVQRVLPSPRDARLAEAIHAYLRIQLKLGIVQVSTLRLMVDCQMLSIQWFI